MSNRNSMEWLILRMTNPMYIQRKRLKHKQHQYPLRALIMLYIRFTNRIKLWKHLRRWWRRIRRWHLQYLLHYQWKYNHHVMNCHRQYLKQWNYTMMMRKPLERDKAKYLLLKPLPKHICPNSKKFISTVFQYWFLPQYSLQFLHLPMKSMRLTKHPRDIQPKMNQDMKLKPILLMSLNLCRLNDCRMKYSPKQLHIYLHYMNGKRPRSPLRDFRKP